MRTEYLIAGGVVVVGAGAWFFLRRKGDVPIIAPKTGICEKLVDKAGEKAAKTGNPYAVGAGIAASTLSNQLCKGGTWALKKGLEGAKASVKFVGKEAKVVGKAVGSTATLYATASVQQTTAPLRMIKQTTLNPIKTTKNVGRAVLGAPGVIGGAISNPGQAAKTVLNPIKATKAVQRSIKKVFGF